MLGLGLAALPQKLLAEIVGFVAETAIVVGVTWHVVSGHYELKEAADLAKAQQAAAVQYQSITQKYNDVSAQLETAKAQKQIVYQTITREIPTIIDRPVYLQQCMDSDGVKLVNQALMGGLGGQKISK